MKKVCFFHIGPIQHFHGYSVDSLDPAPYFPRWSSLVRYQKLSEAKSIDTMYRERDPAYMRFVDDFVRKFHDADLLILGMYNPIHPEVLVERLSKPIKVIGFVDDPYSTYTRGIPWLWAFDGAFYISPAYNERTLLPDALKKWGCNHIYWWPLVPPNSLYPSEELWPLASARREFERRGDAFFRDRDLDLVYVGNCYSSKMDRLAILKKKFGNRFQIHGSGWAYGGYVGMLRWLNRKPAIWSKISSLSAEQRTSLYYRTKIGINMHLSGRLAETGNMRMYEVPAHGMMLLCDKAALNAHEMIFRDGKEAVFYDSIPDAIDKIGYYLAHDREREEIARAGFDRVARDYDGETNFRKLLDWASSLPRKNASLKSVELSMPELQR